MAATQSPPLLSEFRAGGKSSSSPSAAAAARSLHPRRAPAAISSAVQRTMEPRHSASAAAAAAEFRCEFLRLLESRHSSPLVPIHVEPGIPITNPLYQKNPPDSSLKAMLCCPRELPGCKIVQENFYIFTEEGQQGRIPVLLLKLEGDAVKRKPAIVFLHSSYTCKEWLRPLLEAYASRGYVSIAIDSRYHGERASSSTTYIDELILAWKNGNTMPFIFDTVWDLIKLGDYLHQRQDIDPSRIGITGESLGGMHAWFSAAVDTRYKVVVPIIGIQGFRWAIDNDQWQARVNSIKPLFEEARIDLGKAEIDKEAVKMVWDRIAPGLCAQFDSTYSVPAIAPRPLLILNGAEDARCPLAGVEESASKALEAYEEAGFPEYVKLIAEPGIGHELTPHMVKEASDWFDRFLK